MLKKYGRWFADWYDSTGKRHRKSFPTKNKALRFQTEQRNTAARKKARPSARSRKSATSSPRVAARATPSA